MTTDDIQDRFDEIQLLIQEEDLSRATRRMLDFFADFRLPASLKQEAIALRASYNAFAALEKAEVSLKQQEALLQRAQALGEQLETSLTEVADQNQPPAAPKPLSAEAFFEHAPAHGGKKGELVFKGKGITKTFGNHQVTFRLPALDLDLRLGEITGVVGENGNGKTTLLRIVAGELEADEGSLDYPAFDVSPPDWYRIKQNIAFIPQQLRPWQGFLKENLHFSAAIHGIKGRENEEQVNFMIHRLGLTKYEDALWSEISSGFKLRFTLAQALVWRPKLLIIDEPLANLDINTQQIFLQDLRYLADSIQYPVAILLTSQHLHEVESIADNIIFMKNGEALYNGSMAEFGNKREENLFELSTPASKAEIMAALKAFVDLTVEDGGKIKVIHFPLDVSSQELLNALLSAGIEISYFRDISHSTLKLFRQHAKKS
jgi:ABC-2 type transport system ATP-binding protein